jgi:hypothetical protein
MKRISHERALQLAAMDLSSDISHDEQVWLEQHMKECRPCAAQVALRREMLDEMRAVSVAATAALVRTTRVKVRARAIEMQQRQSRRLSVWLAITVALMWYALSTPYVFQASDQFVHWTHLPELLAYFMAAGAWFTPALVGIIVAFSQVREQRAGALG